MKRKNQIQSFFLLVLTAVIWGLAFVAQEVGAQYLGTFTFNGIRFALGAVSLVPVIALFGRESMSRSGWKKLVIASLFTGTVLFLASTMQQYGVELGTPAGKAGFITGLYTVNVPVASFLFFRRRTGLYVWIGALLAVAGLLLLNLDESFTLSFGAGEICVLIGSVLWAGHILVIDKFVDEVSPLKFSMGQFIVCSAESLFCALLWEDGTAAGVKAALVPLLYGGIMSVGVAYTCQTLGQKNTDPTVSAIVLSTESVFSVIGGVLILHAHMEPQGYLGCALILSGIILAQLKQNTASEGSASMVCGENLT